MTIIINKQEISITVTSKRSVDEVQIVENKKDASSINTEDFLDQQEWDLFDFVECANKTIYDPWRKYDRSAFSVKSFISRKPGYYLYKYKIFLLNFLFKLNYFYYSFLKCLHVDFFDYCTRFCAFCIRT